MSNKLQLKYALENTRAIFRKLNKLIDIFPKKNSSKNTEELFLFTLQEISSQTQIFINYIESINQNNDETVDFKKKFLTKSNKNSLLSLSEISVITIIIDIIKNSGIINNENDDKNDNKNNDFKDLMFVIKEFNKFTSNSVEKLETYILNDNNENSYCIIL